MSTLVLFRHILKTGGTSFKHWLVAAFARESSSSWSVHAPFHPDRSCSCTYLV